MSKFTSTIWLIDDDPLTNMIHETLLDHYNSALQVRTFTFAGDALEALSSEEETPDLIFLDINMPEIDGWQFLDSYEKLKVDSRLIMVSSSIYSEDINRAKSYSSVEQFISKPLTLEHLGDIILKKKSMKV